MCTDFLIYYLCCKVYNYIWRIIINVYYFEASKIFFPFFFFASILQQSKRKKCNIYKMHTLNTISGARRCHNLFLIGELKGARLYYMHQPRNRLVQFNSLSLCLYVFVIRSTFLSVVVLCLSLSPSLPLVALHSFFPVHHKCTQKYVSESAHLFFSFFLYSLSHPEQNNQY